MGDRGNVYMKEDDRGVYLYTHWSGSELPFVVQNALKQQRRWSDGPYLARIIFCEMVKGQELKETGFGISTHMPDNEHPILVVDSEHQCLGFAPMPKGHRSLGGPQSMPEKWVGFEEFASMTVEQICLLRGDKADG